MSDESESELFADVERVLDDSAVALTDDRTQFYTYEALSALSAQVGDLFRAEHEAAFELFATMEDAPGELREAMADFLSAQRERFSHWLYDHGLTHVNWWCQHSTGILLLWQIKPKEH